MSDHMNIDKIREALKAAIEEHNRLHASYGTIIAKVREALAELDKPAEPGKVLTGEEIKRIVEDDITEMSHVGLAPNDAAALKMSRAFMERGLRYARDNGYLASAAGLTVEEALRAITPFTSNEVMEHYRARLTAAIEAKQHLNR